MQPERILIRGVNWLGDAVMTLPALHRVREAYPRARLALLTPAKLADFWVLCPDVDEVIAFAPRETVFQVARRLKHRRFDTALLLPNSPRTALEAWLARIPRRIGFARPGRNWFLTRRVGAHPGAQRMRRRSAAEVRRLIRGPASSAELIPATAHQIFHYLHLGAALGARSEPAAPRLVIADEEIEAVRRRFDLPAGSDGHPVFGLNPGAEYGPAKRWPRERFLAAAAEVRRRTRCRWLILGGQTDFPLASDLAARLSPGGRMDPGDVPARNLAGATTLGELCGLLKICRVLVTNDSGPMHVAAAVGTPVVVPFGSTSPELTGPGLPSAAPHRVLRGDAPCAPCFRRECPIDFRCMKSIGIDRMVDAVLGAVARG